MLNQQKFEFFTSCIPRYPQLHAEYNPGYDEYHAHRICQTFELSQFIRNTMEGCDLVLLAGDLNTRPSTVGYQLMTQNTQLKDCWITKVGKQFLGFKFYGIVSLKQDFAVEFYYIYIFKKKSNLLLIFRLLYLCLIVFSYGIRDISKNVFNILFSRQVLFLEFYFVILILLMFCLFFSFLF